MHLTVNGTTYDLPDQATVAMLLERMDLNVAHVAVERNRELVPRREHATTALSDGDQIEIVTFVGGG
ncbi:MAG: sulfur carrier protein ThiS [Pirellulales bacterium]|nr:sulfur carrier protein ThiS [Pirellulales bacterium]